MTKITPIILSGGIGSRLWPLSTKNLPKQFLNLPFNSNKTLFEQTLSGLKNKKFEKPIIVCSEGHKFLALESLKSKNKLLYNFLLNKWYFDELYEKVFVKPTKIIGTFFWKSGDIKTIDKFGPDGISKIIKIISNKSTKFQSGYIYDYAFVMLLGLSLLLTIFIFYK